MTLSGSPFDFVSAFLGGVLVSFTPCIYPLIPITVGFVGAQAGGRRLLGFFYSLAYVSGMAATYALLGIAASLTGTMFGTISAHPLTLILVGSVVIIFGLSMLGAIKIPFIGLSSPLAAEKRGFAGTFLLGASCGLIASPCVTPVLSSILLYLATKQNLLYGALLLLCFGYGLGLLLIVAGTSSFLLSRLPHSGKWAVIIKRIYAFVLILAGIYVLFTGIMRRW